MNNLIQNKKITGIAFWIWGATIFILSAIPNAPTMKLELNNSELRMDYIVHFGVYFSLGILFFLWFLYDRKRFSLPKIFILILCGVVFAGLSEIIQIIVPGRTFNIFDFYSNNLGLFSGVFIPFSIYRKKKD